MDDFDELLFSYIATNGGANRNATKLTREEFITGFEMFLDKGNNKSCIISTFNMVIIIFIFTHKQFCNNIVIVTIIITGGNEDERLGLYFTVFSDGETTMSFTGKIILILIGFNVSISTFAVF